MNNNIFIDNIIKSVKEIAQGYTYRGGCEYPDELPKNPSPGTIMSVKYRHTKEYYQKNIKPAYLDRVLDMEEDNSVYAYGSGTEWVKISSPTDGMSAGNLGLEKIGGLHVNMDRCIVSPHDSDEFSDCKAITWGLQQSWDEQEKSAKIPISASLSYSNAPDSHITFLDSFFTEVCDIDAQHIKKMGLKRLMLIICNVIDVGRIDVLDFSNGYFYGGIELTSIEQETLNCSKLDLFFDYSGECVLVANEKYYIRGLSACINASNILNEANRGMLSKHFFND